MSPVQVDVPHFCPLLLHLSMSSAFLGHQLSVILPSSLLTPGLYFYSYLALPSMSTCHPHSPLSSSLSLSPLSHSREAYAMNVTGLVHTIRVAKKMTHLAVSSLGVGHSGRCIESGDLPEVPIGAPANKGLWSVV